MQQILMQNGENPVMTSKNVYFLNAPDNKSALIALSGHASLLLSADAGNVPDAGDMGSVPNVGNVPNVGDVGDAANPIGATDDAGSTDANPIGATDDTNGTTAMHAINAPTYELYNFSPRNNKSPIGKGAIAQTVDSIRSFDAFVAGCKANNFEGILIQNGYTTWHEPYKRAIKLGVSAEQFSKIRTYAQTIKKNPPRFNFLFGYNCGIFCYEALRCADIYFENAEGKGLALAFPNDIYERAASAHNVLAFEKIDFRK